MSAKNVQTNGKKKPSPAVNLIGRVDSVPRGVVQVLTFGDKLVAVLV
jgi:hypothetical protein